MRVLALRSAVVVVGVVVAALVGLGGPQVVGPAAVEAQVVLDPGPPGDFSWKGLNWQRRTSAENWGPAYNRRYEAANVSGPDARGYVTLRVTNDTGRSPASAEFSTTRGGFGYGTYVTVVEKRLDVMQPELVWGCLFTYDAAAAPGHTEIDVCEASAWGGGAARNEPVVQTHGYWFDATKAPGQGSVASSFVAGSASVHTHRMVWSPQRLIYETYAGQGFGGALLERTELTGSRVPVPTNEKLHFNFWVFGGNGGNPDRVEADTVVVRDFSFTPASAAATPPTTTTPTETSTSTSPLTRYPSSLSQGPHLAADVTGDGWAELVSFEPGSGSWWTTSARSDGHYGAPRRAATYATKSGWGAHLAADVTGNGRAELLSFHPGNGSWWSSPGHADGSFGAPRRAATYATKSGWGAHLAADVTGDGRAELLSFHPGNGSWWMTSVGADGTFGAPKRVATYATRTGWGAHLAADVTGNGRAELLSFHPGDGSWWSSTARSDGSFGAPKRVATYATRSGWGAHLAADVTGDGRAELVSFHPTNASWWITTAPR
jgi:hypothetical protein